MCIQPKDEIKESPACIIRRINYRGHDESTAEGPLKHLQRQIPLLSPVTLTFIFKSVIHVTNVLRIKRQGFLQC